MSVAIEGDRNVTSRSNESSDTPRDDMGEDVTSSSQADPTSKLDYKTLQHHIDIKILLLPCVIGLRAAVIASTKLSPESLAHMRKQARKAIKYAEENKADEALLARSQFYLALVNHLIGPSKGDSPTEEPKFLFEEAILAEGYDESIWAYQWYKHLRRGRGDTGSKTSSPKPKPKPKPGLIRQAGEAFWNRLSPKSMKSRTEVGNTSKSPPSLGHLSQPSSPGSNGPPTARRLFTSSPSSNGPETARQLFTPSTPRTHRNKDVSTPGTRESVTSQLSGYSNINATPGGENLDFDMTPGSPESAFDPSDSPSHRKAPALQHRGSILQEAHSPKSPSPRKLGSPFSRVEETLPLPITASPSPRKHARAQSLAINIVKDPENPVSRSRKTSFLLSRAKPIDPEDEAEKGSASAPPSRTTFDAKEIQARDQRRKTVAVMPIHVEGEDMMKLMEEGNSPVLEKFEGK